MTKNLGTGVENRMIVRAHVPDYIFVDFPDQRDFGHITPGSILRTQDREELIIFVGVRDDGEFAQRKYFRTVTAEVGAVVRMRDYRAVKEDFRVFHMYEERSIRPSDGNPMDLMYYLSLCKEARKHD